eukprot:CAMPEP_0179995498 /NCGR_PEP_ID=MMETSP0984-20121128/7115_1 /TAXON_ID=483367 /ORGANISM="non described non described, Strain CCMP 2436" /LENGTH=640 /DNA_ID=CAMNT_0021914989 /DNA_START=50 /DNA_END=1972 /DNA_ORIENTATION=-
MPAQALHTPRMRAVQQLFVLFLPRLGSAAPRPGPRPHILLILADDVGWANVGYNNPTNPELRTPRIDALVRDGVRLDRHYAHWTCSPSRVALLSGRLPAHNIDQLEPPYVVTLGDDDAGFQGMPRNMTSMADVLRSAGYRTVMVGKWDIGMATPRHTPKGRGFDRSLTYFHHAINYFTYTAGSCSSGAARRRRGGRLRVQIAGADSQGGQKKKTAAPIEAWTRGGSPIDLWRTDETTGLEGPATSLSGWAGRQRSPLIDPHGGAYVEHLLLTEALEAIATHPPAGPAGSAAAGPASLAAAAGEIPLFLLYSSHLIHLPHQLPAEVAAPFAHVTADNAARGATTGMLALLDTVVGELAAAFKGRGWWDRTLLVFVSDNGGHVFSGGNNYPLRSGKYSPLEGGIRVPAFVSGGFIPERARGSASSSLVHIADWYATLARLAGVSSKALVDRHAAVAGLPPIDSLDVWGAITAGQAAQPSAVHSRYGAGALARGELWGGGRRSGGFLLRHDGLKLLVGAKLRFAKLRGAPVFPTSRDAAAWRATRSRGGTLNCSVGCLFDTAADPYESADLVADPGYAREFAAMSERMAALTPTQFERRRRSRSGAHAPSPAARRRLSVDGQADACRAAMEKYGGTWGPWIDL